VRRFAPQLCAQLFCFSLLLFFVSASQGQIPIRPGNRQDIQNREWALGNIRSTSRDANSQFAREQKVALEALRDDFRKLQIVNNDLMKRTFVQKTIKPEEIRASLGEIRKLAQRLRTSFNLPEPKNTDKASSTDYNVNLSPGLLLLDQSVMRFVENPFFQQPRVLDMEAVTQAGNDLNEILRLTDYLRKLTKERAK
jgi:hypothetical protein